MRPLIIVCGVRPHYIKAAALVRIIDQFPLSSPAGLQIIDARQHYDPDLTDQVIRDLGLNVTTTFEHLSQEPGMRGGTIYGKLTSWLGIDRWPDMRRPIVLSFGDTTTTLMTALAAVMTQCPFIHVEAGVRSTPGIHGQSIENHIRRIIGQISSVNLCVLPEHVTNLTDEKAPGRHAWVGDLGRELLMELAHVHPPRKDRELLCLIHKTENTTVEGIAEIFTGLATAAVPTSFVVHPSIGRLIGKDIDALRVPANVSLIPPMPYRALVQRLSQAQIVLTDSGGIQREAYHLRIRCVVRRDTAGWKELFEDGGHLRVGRSAQEIALGVARLWASPTWTQQRVPDFFKPDGPKQVSRILSEILKVG